jgi:hypothetical protein
MNQNGWFQLNFPLLQFPSDTGLHIEFYVKIYHQKIRHVMVSFRGTDGFLDWSEDINTWGASILRGEHTKLHNFIYWDATLLMLANFKEVLTHLDSLDMMADGWQYHVTGHSLGAALANMLVATGYIATPQVSQMKSNICATPKVISFNPPGIRSMTTVCDSAYLEGQVISMRASYDFVSAIGEPYGYVINNDVSEGYQLAKQGFQLLSQDKFSDLTRPEIDAVIDQHLMKNFLQVIANNTCSLTLSFEQLAAWTHAHGGLNHSESAKPFFDLAA